MKAFIPLAAAPKAGECRVFPPLFRVTEGSQVLWAAKPLHSECCCSLSLLDHLLPAQVPGLSLREFSLETNTDEDSEPQSVGGSCVVDTCHVLPVAKALCPVPPPSSPCTWHATCTRQGSGTRSPQQKQCLALPCRQIVVICHVPPL